MNVKRCAQITRILIISLLLGSHSHGQLQPGHDVAPALDSLLLTQFAPDGPGGSVAIFSGDTIVYQRSFGYADLRARQKFTSRTVSNLGSISKTFVAYGILLLRDEGKLSLEESIIRYFPDFARPEIARKVKIKHLLTHTSGLPDLRPVERDSLYFLTADDEANFRPLKAADSLEFEPGTRWNYSNPAFNGLALIIEKVSGMKWQRFIEERIFTPAGMRDSRITDGAQPATGVAHGYRTVNGKYEEYDYGEYPTFCAAGNGGVWSSVEDLRRYFLAMKRGTFADTGTIAYSQTLWHPTAWIDSIPPQNGFSWFVGGPDADCDAKRVFHTGHQAGFVAYFEMFPDKNILVIIEMNSDKDLDRFQIYRTLLRYGYL